MPLHSPYGPRNASTGSVVIAYIDHADKHTLTSFAGRGVLQLAVQNLLHNLANDIRKLTESANPTHRPDAFDIVGILCEHRMYSLDKFHRLSGTSVGRSPALSLTGRGLEPLVGPREGQSKGRTAAKRTPITPNSQGVAKRRVGGNRKAKGDQTQDPGGEGEGGVGKADE